MDIGGEGVCDFFLTWLRYWAEVNVAMNSHTYSRLQQAFVKTDTELSGSLVSLVKTSHWDNMLGNEDALKCFIDRCSYVSNLLNTRGKLILDFGSGMGFLSSYLADNGAKHVTGVEILETHRRVSAFLAEQVFMVNNSGFIASIEGLPTSYFDIVLMMNSISHVSHPIEVLIKLVSLLKRDGLLFIEENNNITSYLIRRRNRRIWKMADIEYQDKRLKYIETHYPDLQTSAGRRIAKMSYGLGFDEIDHLVESYQVGGKYPYNLRSLRDHAPFDPETGIYHENAFLPTELDTILFNMGVISRSIRPKYIFSFRRHDLVSWLFQHFPRPSLYISPSYEILAVKR